MPIDMEYEILIPYDLQFFADDAGDKTEEPTSKKLDDARDEGQVAQSRELTGAVELVALFVILKSFMSYIGSNLMNGFTLYYGKMEDIVHDSGTGLSITMFNYLMRNSLITIMRVCLPIFAIGVLIAFVLNLIQVQWHPTTKPLQPKLSKFNPVNGFKRMFSTQSLFELVKSIAKILVIAIIAYICVKNNLDFLFVLYDIPLLQAIILFGNMALNMGIRISIFYLIIGIIDYLYQRHKFHKDMMMTKQEIKDEYKNQEGSQEVKSKQKQRMREASRRRMMQEVPKADVIITNPTHLAVALKYTPGEQSAPVVLAKGEDYLAQRIKDIARENNIEIVENKPLARMLYMNVEVGEAIPPELYQAVADVLAYVYKVKNKL